MKNNQNLTQMRMRNRQIKVCPIVTRFNKGRIELLVFKHPMAGTQVVKGTLEATDSSIENAACRELAEESGITQVGKVHYLKSWESGYQNQLWHFVWCEVKEILADSWQFYTEDDGGHHFDFYWHALGDEIPEDTHELFQSAIKELTLELISFLSTPTNK